MQEQGGERTRGTNPLDFPEKQQIALFIFRRSPYSFMKRCPCPLMPPSFDISDIPKTIDILQHSMVSLVILELMTRSQSKNRSSILHQSSQFMASWCGVGLSWLSEPLLTCCHFPYIHHRPSGLLCSTGIYLSQGSLSKER